MIVSDDSPTLPWYAVPLPTAPQKNPTVQVNPPPVPAVAGEDFVSESPRDAVTVMVAGVPVDEEKLLPCTDGVSVAVAPFAVV